MIFTIKLFLEMILKITQHKHHDAIQKMIIFALKFIKNL